jgi:hypothetical protein
VSELVRAVAKAIAAVWSSENKNADIEQAATLFEPSARAAIEAYKAQEMKDLAEKGITVQELSDFLNRPRFDFGALHALRSDAKY